MSPFTSVEAAAADKPSPESCWRHLHESACAPYARHGRFAWHFARGKLGRDPIFRALLDRGHLSRVPYKDVLRVVDIGCGQGLLASLLHHLFHWSSSTPCPAAWSPQAQSFRYLGIELMRKDVARAENSIGALCPQARFVCADMREQPLPPCDLVVILDVLHYVNHAQQEALITRVAQALGAHGRLLLRIGDAEDRVGFAASQWVDGIVTFIRGHRTVPQWGRSLEGWIQMLRARGFDVTAEPMSQGTPFANVLLVADRHEVRQEVAA